ncbi:MAG: DUF3109 family protein [Bacteroidales bacterium]|nr:DUF3109 family protein [Bacteroidales bacterium]
MLQIENTIISDDVIEKKFACNLKICKGVCCVEGDSGAPLEKDERELLEKEYSVIKKFLRPQGQKAIDKNGLYYIDEEHDYVTTLVDGKECAFTVFDNEGIAACGIEKAFEAGETKFRKPLSCWLYPVRTKEISNLQAVNYDVWDICKSAVLFGEKHNIFAYKFLKEPLIQKFGKEWYEQLKYFAKNSNKK